MVGTRIGIVGTDNSHVDQYIDLINVRAEFPGVRVTALCGDDPQRDADLADRGDVDLVAAQFDDLVGEVDAVIVAARDGALHRAQAAPFLSAGLPVFIDKPLATTNLDAQETVSKAVDNRALLSSYSALRWAPDMTVLLEAVEKVGELQVVVATGPADPDSPWGGLWHYGIHTVEAALHVIEHIRGAQTVSEISVTRLPAATVAFGQAGETRFVLNMVRADELGQVPFHVTVVGRHGVVAREIAIESDYLRPGIAKFLEMIDSGEPTIDYSCLLSPIRVMAAIQP